MKNTYFNAESEFKINSIGFINVLRDENFTYEYKNGKERYSFIYVENGELECHFTDSEKTLKAGKRSVLFVPKHLPCKTTYLKNNTIVKLIIFDIDTEQLPLYLTVPAIKKSPEMISLFNSISKINMHNTLFLSSKIYELIYIIETENMIIPKKYKKIMPAITEIKEKYFENKKLSYYADICNMSESNFRLLFKEYTGKSPIEYRNLIRVSEVKKMLDSGEFSASEAAYLAGFNNMSFFYEVYGRFSNSADKSADGEML